MTSEVTTKLPEISNLEAAQPAAEKAVPDGTESVQLTLSGVGDQPDGFSKINPGKKKYGALGVDQHELAGAPTATPLSHARKVKILGSHESYPGMAVKLNDTKAIKLLYEIGYGVVVSGSCDGGIFGGLEADEMLFMPTQDREELIARMVREEGLLAGSSVDVVNRKRFFKGG